MFMSRFGRILLMLFVVIGGFAANALALWRDPREMEHAFAADVLRDLAAKRFKILDARAEEVRRTRAHFDSGAWKLWWFFDAFDLSDDALHALQPQDMETLISDWQATTSSVTSRLALAQFHYSVAWQKRGSGYSDTVTTSAWAEYDKHKAITTSILDELEEQGRCDVHCRYLQIEARNLGGWSKPLRAVLQKEPTYWHAFAIAAYYLVPQWGGSVEQIETFAREAADATRSEMGDAMYMKAIVITQGVCQCDRMKYDWDRMRRGFEDFQRLFPKSKVNVNRFATYAFEAHDRETFRRLMADPLFDRTVFEPRMIRWAMEPKPPAPARPSNLPLIGLSELTASGRAEYPIVFYIDANGNSLGVSVGPPKIDSWILSGRSVASSVRVAIEPNTTRTIVFQPDNPPNLSRFAVRDADPVIMERVTVIACQTSARGCEAARIPVKIVGRAAERLQLRVIEGRMFDQALGAPVVDDRDSLLGVVTKVGRNSDGDPEFEAEPIHFTLSLQRTKMSVGQAAR